MTRSVSMASDPATQLMRSKSLQKLSAASNNRWSVCPKISDAQALSFGTPGPSVIELWG